MAPLPNHSPVYQTTINNISAKRNLLFARKVSKVAVSDKTVLLVVGGKVTWSANRNYIVIFLHKCFSQKIVYIFLANFFIKNEAQIVRTPNWFLIFVYNFSADKVAPTKIGVVINQSVFFKMIVL